MTMLTQVETKPSTSNKPSPPKRGGPFHCDKASLHLTDCLAWLRDRAPLSIHGVVTDPPYGLVEYTAKEQGKLRSKSGGIWRIPPAFDGHQRAPLPRFTVLSPKELAQLGEFFTTWGTALMPALVPGAHVLIASNPLLSHLVATAMVQAGFEKRGEVVRLVMTMRGGDRPKNAHEEFADVTVMPRSMWEPWLLFRKPLEGRVQDNLRKWKTGALRRVSEERPFGDVIQSAPTRAAERAIAAHPSLKPQAFLRQVVRAMLPLGEGVLLDPFAGSGSTLAAANAVGYESIGTELDPAYFAMAKKALPKWLQLDLDAK
jgi:DNA modification methylase